MTKLTREQVEDLRVDLKGTVAQNQAEYGVDLTPEMINKELDAVDDLCDMALSSLDETKELVEALRELLYGGIESEGSMTPAGDKLEAIYKPGTLAKARSLLSRITSPEK